MNRKLLTLLIALTTGNLLVAQLPAGRISGIVIDASGEEPLPGTTVFIEETRQGTAADRNGEFSFSGLKAGTYTATFSFMGYHSKTEKIRLREGETKRVIIRLQAETKSLDEVIVTAKSEARQLREQAMPVSVITMQQLQGTVNSVEDILTKTVGVTIRSQGTVGSASRLSVRGLEGKRIGFFIDEVPMSENSNFINVNDIPVDMIDRIEIYKGVVPAKFGGSAVGGAVNIVIKEYPPRYLDASYSVESFNTHKASTVFKRNLIKQGLELGGGGFYTYAGNNYTMESPFQKGLRIKRDHDRFENLATALAMKARKWWFDEVEFELVYMKNRKQIQGIQQNIRFAESKSTVYALENALKKDDFLIDGLDLDMSNGLVATRFHFVDTAMHRYLWDMTAIPPVSVYGGELGVAPSHSTVNKYVFANKTNLNYLINHSHSVNLNILTGFISGKPSDPLKDKAIGHPTNFDSRTGSFVAGLGHEYKSPHDIIVNALTAKYYYYSMETTVSDMWGLMPENVNLKKHNWGVSEAIRYRFTPSLLAKASAGYEVRLPTETELIGDGFLLTSSGNLKPERGTNLNFGMLYDKGVDGNLLQVEVNLFYSYLQDMIRYTRGFIQGKYQNFGEMRSLGIEAEAKADITRWLYGYINATFQDLRDTRKYEYQSSVPNPTQGLRMPNIPYFLANAGLELHGGNLFGIKQSNTRLYSDISFIEEYFFDFEQSQNQQRRIPRSLKVDLGLEYSILNGKVTFSAKITNLTNTGLLSEYNYPLPGRAFGARIRYVLK